MEIQKGNHVQVICQDGNLVKGIFEKKDFIEGTNYIIIRHEHGLQYIPESEITKILPGRPTLRRIK